MVKINKNIWVIFVLLLVGCSEIEYKNSIIINAPNNVVFNILENYEIYPDIIPDFHSTVKIISENRTGLGVTFENTSTWGGYKINSIYEVTEYKYNEYIKLENTSQYGITEIVINKITENETEYILINHIKIPSNMKNKLYESFDYELETIKKYVKTKNK
jgi:hypothetical protein